MEQLFDVDFDRVPARMRERRSRYARHFRLVFGRPPANQRKNAATASAKRVTLTMINSREDLGNFHSTADPPFRY